MFKRIFFSFIFLWVSHTVSLLNAKRHSFKIKQTTYLTVRTFEIQVFFTSYQPEIDRFKNARIGSIKNI